MEPTLTDVRNQRKQIQTDIRLLKNRVKLLQAQEAKTWKRIGHTKQRHSQIQSFKERISAKRKEKQELQALREEQIKQAHQINQLSRASHRMNKQKQLENIAKTKKTAYQQGKEQRSKSMQRKAQILSTYTSTNKQKSQVVKLEEQRRSQRQKELMMKKKEKNREDYLQRVKGEEQRKKQLEQEVMELEILEMELIKKLQNTQQIQQKVVSELEQAIAESDQQ